MREPILNIAVEAAFAAGDLIMRARERLDTIKISEKSPNDFVTDVDQRAEKVIISMIQKAHPKASILAEERGHIAGSELQWIIDPLDGTRNFIHGFPHFAISIAISLQNRIEHGVIYDPVRQEIFTASRGKGAHLNNRRIRASKRKYLSEALLGTGFAHRHADDKSDPFQPRILEELLSTAGDIRRAGAAALDLAYVACGRFDGFWEFGLKIWDIAAGILIIKEAGGLITDPHGGENYLKTGDIVAANSNIMKPLLKTIKTHMPKANNPL